MTDAYIEGFCKTAEEHGFLLIKESADIDFSDADTHGYSINKNREDYLSLMTNARKGLGGYRNQAALNGLVPDTYINRHSGIMRVRMPDGSVKYFVSRSLTIPDRKDGAGRAITHELAMMTDSPRDAVRLARGRLDTSKNSFLGLGEHSRFSNADYDDAVKAFKRDVLDKGMKIKSTGLDEMRPHGLPEMSGKPWRRYTHVTDQKAPLNVLRAMRRVVGNMSKRNKLLSGAGILGIPSGAYGLYRAITALRDRNNVELPK